VNQTVVRHVHGKKLDVKGVPVPTLTVNEPIAAFLLMNIQGQHKAVVKKGRIPPDYGVLRIALRRGHQSCGTLQPRGRTKPSAQFRFCTKLVYNRSGKPVGGVEVVESLSGVDRTLERLRLALLLGIPLCLILAGAGGWVLAGRALEPVDRISRMARSITATDLSRRINLKRQDELGRLAGTFDEMIDRLERAFQEQRQLTADVSHELRSPLSILEAQTTLALRRLRSADEYRGVLASMQEEIERMSSMLNQLLMLARAEVGEEQIRPEPVCLATVAEPVIDGMGALARERGVRLELQADSSLWIEGDATRMRQLLVNLLDNAVRHTPKDGHVDITIDRMGDQARLVVADTGEGISPEDLPHVFQRFYRGDRARRRGTGHSGLGLAIVRWIVEAHGGDVRVSSVPGRGARFVVTLPMLRDPVRPRPVMARPPIAVAPIEDAPAYE
jgi:heavy metal sensor kinase